MFKFDDLSSGSKKCTTTFMNGFFNLLGRHDLLEKVKSDLDQAEKITKAPSSSWSGKPTRTEAKNLPKELKSDISELSNLLKKVNSTCVSTTVNKDEMTKLLGAYHHCMEEAGQI